MSATQTAISLAARLLPQRANDYLLQRLAKELKVQFEGELTGKFLQSLLKAMHWAFLLVPGYCDNIRDFRGKLVFRTADGNVATAALFDMGNMFVEDRAEAPYDVRVTFTDADALWSFLLSENQDVLDSILANTVDVDGNLNYLYRFGFLAKDLTQRLGIAAA